MISVTEICLERTGLTPEETAVIEDLSRHLQQLADVSQADVFIDCPLPDSDAALVVAQAHPATAPSLYKTSVVGQYAHAENEPAVMFCLVSGRPVIGSRGISQEQIVMQQNVTPIRSEAGKVIGALIIEQDISERVRQERNVERLLETTEQLSETLGAALIDGGMQTLMHEGIVLFDERERLTYANPRAREMLKELGHTGAVEGRGMGELFFGRLKRESVLGRTGVCHDEFQMGNVAFELKAVAIHREQKAAGGLMLIRDISDLKEKEKQLVIKSAVIQEIHHRVKNNLQTVSSLLRLQMRRTKLEEVRKVYRDSINRINSIAVIHEMLAFEGLDTIFFNDVAERIAKNIVSSTAKPEQTIRITITGDELALPSDVAATLALAVNELVQNSVMHAFAAAESGEIVVALHSNGPIARVRVSDNGAGMALSPSDGKSHLGLKITETLVQENLDGMMSIVSDGRGTEVQITFPLSKA
ncbi:histidine kinase [Paenibacillus darwinianus]|uniref:histidine kinase n=1 Tax=Paenibacillus darwinianus TaxID=1380763 RepID=A0A9W5W7B1_9BACL|nr:histidine kinase N-terminal domain-containing protein [Paenibacillus darwinianus]EXX87787.1 histidine kinase [Paenibacillus darwinianus]EXX88161.1 histidine kinase [Paenibacillus darwinianus]EXX89040.1 histidine kinase [Paenibacillus darwinianus]